MVLVVQAVGRPREFAKRLGGGAISRYRIPLNITPFEPSTSNPHSSWRCCRYHILVRGLVFVCFFGVETLGPSEQVGGFVPERPFRPPKADETRPRNQNFVPGAPRGSWTGDELGRTSNALHLSGTRKRELRRREPKENIPNWQSLGGSKRPPASGKPIRKGGGRSPHHS